MTGYLFNCDDTPIYYINLLTYDVYDVVMTFSKQTTTCVRCYKPR